MKKEIIPTIQEIGQTGNGEKIDLEKEIGINQEEQEEQEEEEEQARIPLNLPIITAIGSMIGAMQIKDKELRAKFVEEFNEQFPEIIEKYGLKEVAEKAMGVNFNVILPKQIDIPIPWWGSIAAIIVAMGATMWSVGKKYRELDQRKRAETKKKPEQEK